MSAENSESILQKAMIAGISCAMSSTLLNPIDVTKIRMQNERKKSMRRYKGLGSGLLLIFKQEGLGGLCKGIPPSILREMSYSSLRIGAYEPIRALIANTFSPKDSPPIDLKHTSPWIKFLSALITGGVGSALANPLDLVKTRFQANLPEDPMPYGGSTLRAFGSIYRKEGGIGGLYRGWIATSARAAFLTSAQLGSYDSIKHNLLIDFCGFEEGLPLHFAAAMTAGLITTTVTNPFDVVKTRYMSAVSVTEFSSVFDCAAKILRNEGFRAFMKGWVPSYWRIGPHTIISFILIEKIRLYFNFEGL